MGDTCEPSDGIGIDLLDQFRHPLGAACPFQLSVGMHGNPAGVITPVFKPFQAFKQDGGDIPLTHCTDDSAHTDISFRSPANLGACCKSHAEDVLNIQPPAAGSESQSTRRRGSSGLPGSFNWIIVKAEERNLLS